MFILDTIESFLNLSIKNSKTRCNLDPSLIRQIQKKFYVINIKTSGASLNNDTIDQIDLVCFKDTKITKSISLTNSQYDEQEMIEQTVLFLDDALFKKTPVYLMNSSIEFDFLIQALEKYHYSYQIKYFNLLSLSRRYMKEGSSLKDLRKQMIEKEPLLNTAMITGQILIELLEE